MAALARLDGREDGRHYSFEHEGRILEVPSVTTILGIIGKPYLVPWAVKEALKRALSHISSNLDAGTPLSPEQLAALLAESNDKGVKENERILSAAGEFGNVAHECIEDFLNTGERTTDDGIRAKVGQYISDLQAQIETLSEGRLHVDVSGADLLVEKVQAVLAKFYSWWDGEGFVVVSTEMQVYSPTALAAGTLDCLAFKGDSLCLLDWKTSNYYSTDYALQTVAYKHFYQELTGHEIGDIWIVRIGKKDAELQVVHIPAEQHAALYETFLAVRALWQWKKDYKHGSQFGGKGISKRANGPKAPPPHDADAPPARRRKAEPAAKGSAAKPLTEQQKRMIAARPAA